MSNVVTIDKIEFDYQLLKLRQAMSVQMAVVRLVSGTMGKGEADDDLLYTIGIKLCKGLLADGFEILDIDDFFQGKPLLFNKVIIEGAKQNFPDLFDALKKSGGNKLTEELKKVGLS